MRALLEEGTWSPGNKHINGLRLFTYPRGFQKPGSLGLRPSWGDLGPGPSPVWPPLALMERRGQISRELPHVVLIQF